jgi:hypothetical protein
VKHFLLIITSLLQLFPVKMFTQTGTAPHAKQKLIDTTQNALDGIKFVDLTGTIKKSGNYFVLQLANLKTYRLNCTSCNFPSYINKNVKVHGVLVQGYNNPKYGDQNLPVDKIDPKDIIEVITGVTVELLPDK